ncbi:MAG: hypothetical protein JST00_46835 [Deltaproteobacteria bacterium]|nr:hypothetical protein [Deltaproteobacteria bacterium]
MTAPIAIPPLPPARRDHEDGGRAELPMRYEDVTQDGRVQLTSIMWGLGHAVWRSLLAKMPVMERFRAEGVLPILRRLVVVGEERSVTVNLPVHYEGSFRFAHEEGGERIFANMWLEARAPVGSTLMRSPPRDAPAERMGRIFAEHVVTRPFAPPAERKVTRLEVPGLPAIPEDAHPFETAEALVAGSPLEEVGDVVFGMMHTDSNQHVNSLVYPRVFEEHVVKKLATTGHPGAKTMLMRALELRYRKPFFAGDRATIAMRMEPAAGSESGVDVVGAFGDPSRPHCTLRMTLR